MLTAAAIEGFKQEVERKVTFGRYKIGGTYFDAPLRKERMSDGAVAIYLTIEPDRSGKVTITEVQLLDNTKQVWATKAENMVLERIQEGYLYRFTINFQEVSTNV